MKQFDLIQVSNFLNLYHKKTNSFIHSKHNPVVESSRFATGFKELINKKRRILIFGFGLGYYIQAILDSIENSINLICIETYSEILDFPEVKKKFLK